VICELLEYSQSVEMRLRKQISWQHCRQTSDYICVQTVQWSSDHINWSSHS